jgi:hypothetical protein
MRASDMRFLVVESCDVAHYQSDRRCALQVLVAADQSARTAQPAPRIIPAVAPTLRIRRHEYRRKKTRRVELVVSALRHAIRVILWPPFYNRANPRLIGIPFFYWFQLLWVLVSAVTTAVVYFAVRD